MAGEEDDKEIFFSTLSTFQRQGTMVDVIVEVENEQFPCHRLVLSVYSLYFRAMFSSRMREEREPLVRLSALSADQFRLVHDYVYGRLWGRLGGALELHMALQLAEAANYLDMKSLLQACDRAVIKAVSLDNVLRLDPDVYETCCRFNMAEAMAHIDGLYTSHMCASPALRDAFLRLPGSRVAAYLGSDRLRARSEMGLVALLRRRHELRAGTGSDADGAADEGVSRRLLAGVRVGLLHTKEDIDDFLALCDLAQVPVARVTPWPDAFQMREALVSQPFWRLIADAESPELAKRCRPRAPLEACCHVTLQDSTFTLRFLHISGPRGADYSHSAHQNGAHPRFCMPDRTRWFSSDRLHRTTSLQWHCCSRDGFFFFYVEQAMEPASQAPGVLCVFDAAREMFHYFDGVTPLLSMMSLASSGDALYILGGRTSECSYTFRSVDSIFAFDLRTLGGWRRLPRPTLPQPAHAQAAATLDGAVFLSGGICHGYSDADARQHRMVVGRPMDCLWRLPADASDVAVLAPMLQARYQHRLLACRQALYAVGGVCDGVSGNQQGGIEQYDPATDQWTALDGVWPDDSVRPAVRFFGPVIALQADGCIYVMGRGNSPANPPTAGLWQFNPAEGKWQMIQLLSWEKQQMLTSAVPWSCLDDHADPSEAPHSGKLRRRNHEADRRLMGAGEEAARPRRCGGREGGAGQPAQRLG